MALLPGQRSWTSLTRAKAPRIDVKGLEHRHCQPRSGISQSFSFFPSSLTIWIAISNPICPFSKIKFQYIGINRHFFVRRDGFRHRLRLLGQEYKIILFPSDTRRKCVTAHPTLAASTILFPLCGVSCVQLESALPLFKAITRCRSETCLVFSHTNQVAVLKKGKVEVLTHRSSLL